MLNLIDEVREKVERPFPEKLRESRQIIAHHFDEFGDKLAVAFSGGKDSQVVLYLCLEQEPDISVIYNNTGVEYPETVRFVARLQELWHLSLIMTHPEKTFWDCVKEHGFSDGTKKNKKGSPRCCYWLKEKPTILAIRQNDWLGMFTGVTAVESRLRMFTARDKGICHHNKQYNLCKINPILWWTEEEAWYFIQQESLPYNPLYDIGSHRIGCMPCTAYKDWEHQLQLTNPKMYCFVKLRKDKQFVLPI